MSSPRRVPIHRALVRPTQLLGCDRGLVFALGMLCATLVGPAGLGRGNPRMMMAGALLFVVGMGLLARLAKADPQMREVFRRRILYADRYAARGRVDQGPESRGLFSRGPFLSRRWW